MGPLDLAPAAATVVFGLLSALSWGCGDFGGGITSKRAPVLGVVLVVELVGAAIAAALGFLTGEAAPSAQGVAIGVAAGFAGVLGILCLYRGLAVGRMGVVAPVTAVIGAGIPVLAGIAFEGLPQPAAVVGIVLGIVAVVLVSRAEGGPEASRSGIELAIAAGIGIGSFNLLISQAPDGEVFWPLTILRLTSIPIAAAIVLVGGQPWRVPRAVLPQASVVGAFDMGGNAFFILAAQAGALAIAAVLSSLYPVVTVLLAILILRERVTPSHAVGIVVAVAAVGLIAVGAA
jgi:drug/metabolite transporter (DMT)-like permease